MNEMKKRETIPFPAVSGDNMKQRKICPALIMLALSVIILLVIPVTADDADTAPQLPQGFYGTVEFSGNLIGQGYIVEAVGPGVRSNLEGNPVTTLADGSYGAANFTAQRLLVQGNIASGTPLEFYVGNIKAEVYDVAAGVSWNTTYAFQPGEKTELNLRIASLPAAGQTREPTPVQTVVATSTVAASSTGAGSIPSGGASTAAPGGSVLPQIPGSVVQQPTAEVPQQSSGDSVSPAQTATTVQGDGAQVAGQPSGTQETGAAAQGTTGNMTLYIAGAVLLLLVIGGGAYYYLRQKKSETDAKEEPVKKEE
jgi:hypothetical protein